MIRTTEWHLIPTLTDGMGWTGISGLHFPQKMLGSDVKGAVPKIETVFELDGSNKQGPRTRWTQPTQFPGISSARANYVCSILFLDLCTTIVQETSEILSSHRPVQSYVRPSGFLAMT